MYEQWNLSNLFVATTLGKTEDGIASKEAKQPDSLWTFAPKPWFQQTNILDPT